MPNYANISNIGDMLSIANQNSGSYFWIGMLFLIFFVATISLSIFGIEIALLASGFIGLIIGILFVYIGIMAWEWLLFFVGLELFMFIYIMWSSDEDSR